MSEKIVSPQLRIVIHCVGMELVIIGISILLPKFCSQLIYGHMQYYDL